MSKNLFMREIAEELKQERIKADKLIKILSEDLPDKNTDDHDTCLYLPNVQNSQYWTQTFEDVLEEAGYDVVMLDDKICILFSEEVQEEIKEQMLEEAKLERARKRRK